MQKIVLADDEPFIATAYQDGFTRAGYDVTVAHDGAEALEQAQEVRPDLVLLDLIMPKLNGFEVLKAIKADASLANVPVMVLSNLSQPTDEAEALSLGAVAFIVKSDLSFQDLLEQVQKILAKE